MPEGAVYNVKGEKVGSLALSDAVFGAPVNESVLHDVTVAHLANRRQGTVNTKTRAFVSGGGRKPWRQKGTGRARQGSIRSPQWVGGGTVFGPHPKEYDYRLPRKVRQQAIRSALSAKVEAEKLVVVDTLALDGPKTKSMVEVLSNLHLSDDKALIVLTDSNPNVVLSARNLPGVKTLHTSGLNVLDLLHHDALVLTRDAVARVEEVWG